MRSRRFRLLTVLATALPAAIARAPAQDAPPQDAPAEVDRITLDDGNVLFGKITAVVAGHVELTSALLGELDLPVANIREIQSTTRVRILTDDGQPFEAIVESVADGVLRYREDGQVREMPLASLAAAEDALAAGEERWSGSLTAGGAYLTGNSNERNATVTADIRRRTDTDRLRVLFSYTFGEEKDSSGNWQKTKDRVFGSAQYDRFLSPCDFLYGNVSLESDEFADVDLRTTVGVGYGRQLFDRDDLQLTVEGGLSYVDKRQVVGPDDSYPAARVSYTLLWGIVDDLRFIQDVEWFPSLEDPENLVRQITRLQLDVSASILAEFRYEFTYDSAPGTDAGTGATLDRLDNRFFLNVGWTF
jgi:putative salt-induced outer membrane protein YdiY